MPAIECRDLVAGYRHSPAILGASFVVSPGEHVALFGGMGAGKSSLLAVLAGVLPAQSGSVSVLGNAPDAARPDLAYVPVPQDRVPHASVTAAVSRALAPQRLPRALRAARIAEAIELLELGHAADAPVIELSHGARIGVALACAIASHPAVLLVDNVLAELPPALTDRVFRHVSDRRSLDGLVFVHATTSSAEAERADRVILLDGGRCVADAPPGDLIGRHASEVVTVEAEDPRAVRRTLRGLFDVEILASARELRFTARDAASVAAHLFRHPEGGLRAVCARRGDLWDVLTRLRTQPAPPD